jgi:serine/threonine protein kinase
VVRWWPLNGLNVPLEIVMLNQCRHVEGVIEMLEYFEYPTGFLIVMERPESAIDMFDFITERDCLDEKLARHLFRQVVETAIRCKNVGVMHRDIKDENLLLNLDTGQLKLIDFGAAECAEYEQFGGTTAYAPPEWILRGSYCLYAIQNNLCTISLP